MTLLPLQHGDLHASISGKRFTISKVTGRLRAAFRAIHEAIVTAKMRRLQSELMFHSGVREDWTSKPDTDAAKFPRRPLILGDKWDF
jgi:hypothetical protein